ncbi:MAG: VOC family protein [Candidatus Cloacimonetes bacterium]|nr:VOC family protein [Candidatus Cloacimonadota bacterium]
MKLDAIGIVAQDIKESVRFYRLLGLNFPESNEDHIEAVTASGIRVMLDSAQLMEQIHPGWQKPVGQGMVLAFDCGSAEGVDQTFLQITKAGFKGKKEPWDAFWGQRYASVVDPDGNSVDLFAAL